MGDLFARHLARVQQPPPAPVAPRRRGGGPAVAHAIERTTKGGGYEMRVAGEIVVRVLPAAGGWQVHNIGAGHKRTLADGTEAERLAWRIARLMAAP